MDRNVTTIHRIWTAPRRGPAQGNSEGRALVGRAFQALITHVGSNERKSASIDNRNIQTTNPHEPDNDEDDEGNKDDHDRRPNKKRRGAGGDIAMAPQAAPVAAPRPVVHVHMVDTDRIGPPTANASYPWFGVLTRPTYNGVLGHLTMPQVVNLAAKHMPAGGASRAFFRAT